MEAAALTAGAALADDSKPAISKNGEDVKDYLLLERTLAGLVKVEEATGHLDQAVRYLRELRDNPQKLQRVIVDTPAGAQVPLAQLATLRFASGPPMIRDENGLLAGYVAEPPPPDHSMANCAHPTHVLPALDEREWVRRLLGGCCGTDVRHVAAVWGVPAPTGSGRSPVRRVAGGSCGR